MSQVRQLVDDDVLDKHWLHPNGAPVEGLLGHPYLSASFRYRAASRYSHLRLSQLIDDLLCRVLPSDHHRPLSFQVQD